MERLGINSLVKVFDTLKFLDLTGVICYPLQIHNLSTRTKKLYTAWLEKDALIHKPYNCYLVFKYIYVVYKEKTS